MQLCVTLNDLEYMRLWLAELPVSLDWDDVVNAMERAHGTRGGQHARSAMESVLNSADEDMMNKTAKKSLLNAGQFQSFPNLIEPIENQIHIWLSFARLHIR